MEISEDIVKNLNDIGRYALYEVNFDEEANRISKKKKIKNNF